MKTGEYGIPKVYYFNHEGQYNTMVMQLLGKSLEDLLQLCGGKFSIKTVLMIAPQMLDRIQMVQRCHFLHRDIKPDNFSVGVKKHKNRIYLFDLGLAKRFI